MPFTYEKQHTTLSTYSDLIYQGEINETTELDILCYTILDLFYPESLY